MTFKRASTFTATVTYIPLATDPADLSATTVTSSIEADGILYSGTVTKAGDNMSFTVVFTSAVSSGFCTGPILWDVKFVTGSVTFYSATETILCVDNITP